METRTIRFVKKQWKGGAFRWHRTVIFATLSRNSAGALKRRISGEVAVTDAPAGLSREIEKATLCRVAFAFW
jgi:hypothetical protein